jgi:peroxiredoxin (alkyl hydroperoxide reductase subunit C)
MSDLKVNDRAPNFELVDQAGQTHDLQDYRGQPVVLMFYPKDFSGVCSEEHACVLDVMDRFNKLDAQVFGISIDHINAHAAFAEKMGIEYPLLADFHPKGQVGRSYGVYMDDKGFHQRWTFVVDPEGRISFIQKNAIPEVPEIEEILQAVVDAQ